MLKVSRIPLIGGLFMRIYQLFNRTSSFTTSDNYWENRYKRGDNSGSGSYNNLAEFKGDVINEFVAKNNIETVMEFGSGDGNQLKYFSFKNYVGYDVSETAISICRNLFKEDATKQFKLIKTHYAEKAELTLSLDVIYHLVEDDVYMAYMKKLFSSSTQYVIVYSSNSDDHENNGKVPHVKHRKFTDWVQNYAQEFKLIEHVPNKYQYNGDGSKSTYADFFIFRIENRKF